MDNLKKEMDELLETAMIIVKMDNILSFLDDHPDQQEEYHRQVMKIIAEFKEKCIKILPLVEEKMETDEEYKEFYDVLQEAIKVC